MGPIIGSSNVVKCFIDADGFKVDLKRIWSFFLEYRHLEWFEASKAGAMGKKDVRRASDTERIQHWELPEIYRPLLPAHCSVLGLWPAGRLSGSVGCTAANDRQRYRCWARHCQPALRQPRPYIGRQRCQMLGGRHRTASNGSNNWIFKCCQMLYWRWWI